MPKDPAIALLRTELTEVHQQLAEREARITALGADLAYWQGVANHNATCFARAEQAEAALATERTKVQQIVEALDDCMGLLDEIRRTKSAEDAWQYVVHSPELPKLREKVIAALRLAATPETQTEPSSCDSPCRLCAPLDREHCATKGGEQ